MSRPLLAIFAVLFALGFPCRLTFAQPAGPDAPPPDPPAGAAEALTPTHEALLGELASDDYAMREQATLTLLGDESLSLLVLRQMLLAADTLEQRVRLLEVAAHHVLRREREEAFREEGGGALGLAHRAMPRTASPGLNQPHVLVLQTIVGFPAHASIRAGDLIYRIDGEDIDADRSGEAFRKAVQKHKAGDEVAITLLRGAEHVTVQVRLASVGALTDMYDVETATLRAPFLQHWLSVREELLAGAESPVDDTIAVPVP